MRGPTVTPGYVQDPESTRSALTQDGWLRTGDVAYFADGELHLLGRNKDVIIVRGRNYYAHDIETIVSEHPDVRTGNVIAFAIPNGETEALVVVAESKRPETAELIARELRGRLGEALGIVPRDVRIVPAGSLPKTSSGKLKRVETRERYLTGQLLRRRATMETMAAVLRSGLGHIGVRSRP